MNIDGIHRSSRRWRLMVLSRIQQIFDLNESKPNLGLLPLCQLGILGENQPSIRQNKESSRLHPFSANYTTALI